MIRSVDDLYNFAMQIKQGRSQWETFWDEIRRYFDPQGTEFISSHISGEHKGQDVYSSDPISALHEHAAHTYSMLMPLQGDFFSLELEDEKIMQNRKVRNWLDSTERAIYRVFARQNFRNATWITHKDKSTYGTGGMIIEYKGNGQFRFQSRPLVEFYLSEDADEQIDTVVRRFKYSARKIKQYFPDCKDEQVLAAMESDPERQFFILHIVTPKMDKNETRDEQDKFVDLYILENSRYPLNYYFGKFQGQYELTYIIARQDKDACAPYGYSYASLGLADTKTRNKLNELRLRAVTMAVLPPILARNKALISRLRLAPNAVNPVNSQDPGREFVAFNSGARWDITEAEDQRLDRSLSRLFKNNFMSTEFRQTGPNITRAEIEQARASGNRISVPIISREQDEFLGPLVLKVLYHLVTDEQIPPPPPEIVGSLVNVKATGPLALDQQMGKVANAERFLLDYQQIAGTPAGQQIEDAVDFSDLALRMAETMDLWGTSVRTPKEIQERQQARAQEQQMQSQLAMAEQGANAAKGFASVAQ